MPKISRADLNQIIDRYLTEPDNQEILFLAARTTLDFLAQEHPGKAVELRIPMVRVVQLFEGVNHRRGTPPAVVEMSAKTLLNLVTNKTTWELALDNAEIQASGTQSDLVQVIEGFLTK